MPRASKPSNPTQRTLRVYAFDPSRGARLDNHLTIRIPYESLKKGPVGRKIAVIDYQDVSKGRANDDMEFDQVTNRFTVDPGWIWRLYRSRSKPHLAAAFSIHFETPFKRPVDTFFLSSRHVVDPVNNISVRDRMVITQERGFLVLPRVGLRWQNRDTTYFEVGFQRGKEFDAFTGYLAATRL